MRNVVERSEGGGAGLARTTGAVPSPAVKRDRTAVWLAVLAVALGGLMYWLAHAGLSDDSYITLDYARNLAMHGNWGLTSQFESNSATSPLDVLALGGLMFVSRLFSGGPAPLVCLGIFTVATMTITALWTLRIVRDLRLPKSGAVLAAGLVIVEPLALSSVGLETSLLVTLMVGMLSEAIRGRPYRFGVLAGLALMARLDMVIFVLVVGLTQAGIRRGWWRALAALVPVALPWFLFSWIELGSALPVTLAIKQFQHYPGGWTFGSGLLLFSYGDSLPLGASALPAGAGLFALLLWAYHRLRYRYSDSHVAPAWTSGLAAPAALAVAGVVYYCAYSVLGVPPYVWYYAPTLIPLTIFFAFALCSACRGAQVFQRSLAAVIGSLLFLAGLAMDLGQGLPWRAPPIFGNLAMPADYARVGREMGQLVGNDEVISPGEIGTLAYYCHCAIVDQFSDPGRSLIFVRKQLHSADGVRGWLLRLNYRNMPRDTQPAEAEYRLVWRHGWVDADKPGVWNVYSPAPGKGHFILKPL